MDLEITRYYHCISRCVRRAFLCGEGFEHRKQWIEDRLQLLAENFAISVCGFSVMDNHLHVLVRLDPAVPTTWSEEEVVKRWIAIYPPRNLDLDDSKIVRMWVDHERKDKSKVAKYRERLQDLGWFMKSLKEPLARLANKQDDCKGTFWESRYKSIAILDEEALLATCTYIDLNPVAAGMAATPETSKHTSVRQRVRHAKDEGKLDSIKAASRGSVAGSRVAGRMEETHWLCPLEDRRDKGSSREGMQASKRSLLLHASRTDGRSGSASRRSSRRQSGEFPRDRLTVLLHPHGDYFSDHWVVACAGHVEFGLWC